MTNAPFAALGDFRDIESLNHYREAVAAGQDPDTVLAALRISSRDNARTPMQWDATEHAGFTAGTPWLAVNPNHTAINAQAARADPDSVFHHYRRLIELRHREPVVAHGDFTMLVPGDERVFAYTRGYAGPAHPTELLVVANLSGVQATPDIEAGWADAELVLGNCQPGAGLTLQPWEARVYRRRYA
jgi:oligo-1,6-glucosidase